VINLSGAGEEMAKLRFRFNAAKFVNAVAYLAQACPNSTKMTVCKRLYYADKEHLVKYGRPILGDHYYRLEHGPVPTHGLDMLRRHSGPAATRQMVLCLPLTMQLIRFEGQAEYDRSLYTIRHICQ
jgi:Protein of unknown function (DUF4065)